MPQLSEHDRAVLNCVFNPNLPLDQTYDCNELDTEIKDIEEDTADVLKSKQLELEAIIEAEKGNFEKALEILTNAIGDNSGRASLYNNRAQVYQLQGRLEEALDDLKKAIEFGRDHQKRTTCQALCQRGLILRRKQKIEEAKEDFNAAAKLGSQFARNQLVELNPYAALCNQMLRQVFETDKVE